MKRADIVLWSLTAALAVTVCLLAWGLTPSYSPPGRLPAETAAAAPTASPPETLRIHLNTATAAELQQLDGVGDVIAARILAYREAHGGFRSVEELLEVEGIGEKRLAAWRDYLVVEAPA